MKTFKVVHLSTFTKGGAGIAAYRIHETLLNSGVNSSFITLDKKVSLNLRKVKQLQQDDVSFLKNIFKKIKWRLRNQLNVTLDVKETCINQYNKIIPQISCEWASLPFSEYDILQDPVVKSADIIHLHLVTGMLDYPSFFKHNTKPVVWTLHDMNAFLGLYHYKEDEVKNAPLSSVLNAKVLALKNKIINNRKSSLSVVCPSEWLLDKARESAILKNAGKYCIANPIDTEVFFREASLNLREQLNIPKGNAILLFVSEKINIYRKGFDLLVASLKKINHLNVTLLVIGQATDLDLPGLDVRILGTVTEEHLLRNYYSVADAFIISSREDNLPNVMLEAMACGTPVLSFDTGGMSSVIRDNFNGRKANGQKAERLASVINDFIENKENYNPEEIRQFAIQNFSYNIIAEKYKEIYKSILLPAS